MLHDAHFACMHVLLVLLKMLPPARASSLLAATRPETRVQAIGLGQKESELKRREEEVEWREALVKQELRESLRRRKDSKATQDNEEGDNAPPLLDPHEAAERITSGQAVYAKVKSVQALQAKALQAKRAAGSQGPLPHRVFPDEVPKGWSLTPMVPPRREEERNVERPGLSGRHIFTNPDAHLRRSAPIVVVSPKQGGTQGSLFAKMKSTVVGGYSPSRSPGHVIISPQARALYLQTASVNATGLYGAQSPLQQGVQAASVVRGSYGPQSPPQQYVNAMGSYGPQSPQQTQSLYQKMKSTVVGGPYSPNNSPVPQHTQRSGVAPPSPSAQQAPAQKPAPVLLKKEGSVPPLGFDRSDSLATLAHGSVNDIKKIDAAIKLDVNYDSAVGVSKSLRAKFEHDFLIDMTLATQLPRECFRIISIQRGSVIVSMEIHRSDQPHMPDLMDVIKGLSNQVKDWSSELLTGAITQTLQGLSYADPISGEITTVSPDDYFTKRMESDGPRMHKPPQMLELSTPLYGTRDDLDIRL